MFPFQLDSLTFFVSSLALFILSELTRICSFFSPLGPLTKFETRTNVMTCIKLIQLFISVLLSLHNKQFENVYILSMPLPCASTIKLKTKVLRVSDGRRNEKKMCVPFETSRHFLDTGCHKQKHRIIVY